MFMMSFIFVIVCVF